MYIGRGSMMRLVRLFRLPSYTDPVPEVDRYFVSRVCGYDVKIRNIPVIRVDLVRFAESAYN